MTTRAAWNKQKRKAQLYTALAQTCHDHAEHGLARKFEQAAHRQRQAWRFCTVGKCPLMAE